VRTTLDLDDDLLSQAWEYTGIRDTATLVHTALRQLIEREAAKRLAALGGSMPDFQAGRRRRSEKTA